MPSKVLVGMKTGDEGKGKIIDMENPDMTARFQGGGNAGHTVIDEDGNQFIGHNIPSCFMGDGRGGIGKGSVLDLVNLKRECLELEAGGHEVIPRLSIDEKTMLLFPYHRVQDAAEEFHREYVLGEEPVGSTWRGISPAYADESARKSIYAFMLRDKDMFAKAVTNACRAKERLIESMGIPPANFKGFFEQLAEKEQKAGAHLVKEGLISEEELDFTRYLFYPHGGIRFNKDEIIDVYWEAGQKYVDCLCQLNLEVLNLLRQGKDVVFEGAQGCRLDMREGYFPNTTSSHTIAASVSIGIGIAMRYIDEVVGVTKAYETKVGNHVFVTQMDEDEPLAAKLKKHEFGATTGRQRKVGWFDGVEMRTAQLLNGCDAIHISKLDLLSGAKTLRICDSYYEPATGNTFEFCPSNNQILGGVKPVWMEIRGWEADITGCTDFRDLPKEAQHYVAHAAATCAHSMLGNRKPRIAGIGTGPKRNQHITNVPDIQTLIRLAYVNKKYNEGKEHWRK